MNSYELMQKYNELKSDYRYYLTMSRDGRAKGNKKYYADMAIKTWNKLTYLQSRMELLKEEQ